MNCPLRNAVISGGLRFCHRQGWRRYKAKLRCSLSDLAHKRRLDTKAKGEARSRSGRKGDDYLTEEERQ